MLEGKFFLTGDLCLSAGRSVLRLTRLPRHDRGPVPGGNRSAASCLCTVLRQHYTTTRRDRLYDVGGTAVARQNKKP